ncbi:hypothetical protein CC80DRAFT_464352 [Byssothecium circinans]|uniref:Chromo domain-containing protein n=1 Tax=Byssothecium circinans TaxID=147558 RepID=A0A6A5UK48_9PLEO|nr:hypothetical protein CC80DRAFT_464352 [Byssothecium circinans]
MDLEQYDREYETDEVSVTSTVEDGDEGGVFDVEAIISEHVSDTGKQYLIKWAGYPIHCCTWEPPENFAETNLMHVWKNKKLNMGDDAFDEMVRHNHEKFNEACLRAEAAKVRRQEKRAKKRKKLARTKRARIPPIESDSEDDVPLRPTYKRRQSEVASKSREQSAEKSPLFVSSTSKHMARKPPIEQSSSEEMSDDDFDTSQDSLLEELEMNEKRTKKKKKIRKGQSEPRATNASEKEKAPRITTENARRGTSDAALPVQGRTSDLPATTLTKTKDNEKARPITQVSTKGSSNTAGKAAPPTVRRPSTTSEPPAQPKASMATGPKPLNPIKIVNKPKIAPREWEKKGDKLFTTLHYRANALKRSRTEGTPDPTALDFVNGKPVGKPPPKTLDARSRASVTDNPYGRRESGLRVQAEEEDPPQPSQNLSELQRYEVGKIPMACFDWKSANSCKFSAQNCRFMHRDKDPSTGKDYPVTDWRGTVPPKYMDPPQTCWYWLRGDSGCVNSAETCLFAHENTGTLPNMEGKGLEKIDSTEMPRTLMLKGAKGQHNSRRTCWWWMRSPRGCKKPAGQCKFAHENTGVVASLDVNSPPEIVDPNEPPAFMANQHRPSFPTPRRETVDPGRLTCFFWNEGTCKNTEEACSFAHCFTGTVADPPRGFSLPAGWKPHYRGIEESVVSPTAHTRAPQPGNPQHRSLDIPRQPYHDDEMIDASTFEQPLEVADVASKEEQHDIPPVPLPDESFKKKMEAVCRLNFEDMFTYNGSDDAEAILERRAFLFYHPTDHAEELEMMTRWLLTHRVEVFNFWSEGSWEQFQKETRDDGRTGVIMAHPDFVHYAEIRRFADVLRRKVRLWSVGYQPATEYDPEISTSSPEYRFDRIEIFPHGGIIYITDDVFEKKPQVALKIIEVFFAKIEKCRQVTGPIDPHKCVDDGCLLWRLAVRPDFMRALFTKAEEDSADVSETDPDLIARIKLYELLSASRYVEQDETSEPMIYRPDDYFPIMSERGCFMDDLYYPPSVDPTNLSTSETSSLPKPHDFANTKMVEYYGGMLLDHRQYYRQYFVIHTEPDGVMARDWIKRIGVLDEVMTPEKFISEFEKEAKGNRFEFYDWAFPEKKRVDSMMT